MHDLSTDNASPTPRATAPTTGPHSSAIPPQAPVSSTVDVVIPCYNYAHFLENCVRSVLDQPGVDVRVLVIDDCSSDESPEVGARLAAADPRVEFRRHDVNRGHIATYNEGLLQWASADYTVLLSADDLLTPGALRRAADLLDRHPTVGMVYGWSAYFEDEHQLPKVPTRQRGTTVWAGRQWISDRCRSAHNVISSPEVVVRTAVQQQVGGYRPELPHAGDLEMWLRIAAVSDIGYVRGVPQAYYRVHQASMQRATFNHPLDDVTQRRDVFDAFFDEHPQLPDAARLRSDAHQALAREALWWCCRAYDRDDLNQVPVDDLVEFATTTHPRAGELREAHALARRRRLGPTWCHRTQVFAGSAAWKRAVRRIRLERWKRRGTYDR